MDADASDNGSTPRITRSRRHQGAPAAIQFGNTYNIRVLHVPCGNLARFNVAPPCYIQSHVSQWPHQPVVAKGM
jgi:hypothetical protein